MSARPRRPVVHPSQAVRDLMELFDETGMTQAEMAERAGISQSTMSNLRTNIRAYSSIVHVELIGQVLGYHLEWIKDEQPAEQSTNPTTDPDRTGSSNHQ